MKDGHGSLLSDTGVYSLDVDLSMALVKPLSRVHVLVRAAASCGGFPSQGA